MRPGSRCRNMNRRLSVWDNNKCGPKGGNKVGSLPFGAKTWATIPIPTKSIVIRQNGWLKWGGGSVLVAFSILQALSAGAAALPVPAAAP